jgi:hypothetical protein
MKLCRWCGLEIGKYALFCKLCCRFQGDSTTIKIDSIGSHFPLLIEYTESKQKAVVNTPQEIKDGEPFKVLETEFGDTIQEDF